MFSTVSLGFSWTGANPRKAPGSAGSEEFDLVTTIAADVRQLCLGYTVALPSPSQRYERKSWDWGYQASLPTRAPSPFIDRRGQPPVEVVLRHTQDAHARPSG